MLVVVVFDSDVVYDDEVTEVERSVEAVDSSADVTFNDCGGDCNKIFKLLNVLPPTMVSHDGISLVKR